MTSSSPARILIVDDNDGLLRLLERTLNREGFVTATANTGQAALAWLSKNPADLMLLDLKLTDLQGSELINRLKSIERTIPFVIITGQGDERVAVDMMKRGALDYVVKDGQFIELLPTVLRRALAELEKDNRLLAAQAALKESREQLLAISEREQNRFGAELHDGLGQQLTAIELRCHSLKEDLPKNRADLISQISDISRFLREAISQTRSLARGLSPVHLGSGGLVEALGEMTARMSKEGRIKCTFRSPLRGAIRESAAAGHLFRIAQEAVNNAVKHSGGSQVEVSLTEENGFLRLQVSDNGSGLPIESSSTMGIGQQIMKHRASVIGAKLEIFSQPDKGVTVTCILKNKKDE